MSKTEERVDAFATLGGDLPKFEKKQSRTPVDSKAIDFIAAENGFPSRQAKPVKGKVKHLQVSWPEADWLDLQHALLDEGKPSTKDFLLKCFRFYQAHKAG